MQNRKGDEDGIYMSEKTFDKIISDLKSMNFNGKIAPHLYGEPLSDPRLTHWMARIRKELPEVVIRVVTNGDFLTKAKYHELIEAGVTYFDLSKHSPKWPSELERLMAELAPEERHQRLRMYDYWSDYQENQEGFTTRGGKVKLKVPKEHPILCSYVIFPVINTFGDVILCVEDYGSEYKFGNINKRHLLDI
jgi:MoaA/NifB/PqqE/SkfB family radical SAM enzyme